MRELRAAAPLPPSLDRGAARPGLALKWRRENLQVTAAAFVAQGNMIVVSDRGDRLLLLTHHGLHAATRCVLPWANPTLGTQLRHTRHSSPAGAAASSPAAAAAAAAASSCTASSSIGCGEGVRLNLNRTRARAAPRAHLALVEVALSAPGHTGLQPLVLRVAGHRRRARQLDEDLRRQHPAC